jgi:glycine/D-amino acid oxidase-like deaminating enzyme
VSSYWLLEPHEPLRVRPREGTVDVAIVGGGVTGLACALTLARGGRSVRVHEAREVASGASGRNGGFALRGGAMAYDVAREWMGVDAARAYWRWTEDALARMLELARGAFEQVGSLRLAADEEERDEIRREHEALVADGFAAEWRDELPGRIGERFPAAIFHPGDAALQPARWVRQLAVLAVEAGVDLREHDRIASLDALAADRVVVATDGYPSGLLGELEGSIIPTRGQMLATEPLAERVFACPHYGRHGFDYWQQTPDGRVLAGGFRDYALDTEFTADETTTEPIQAALERFVADVVGRPVAIEHRWAGIFGLVLDFLPVVGPHPHDERVWIAGGYSGHGNVLGFACGEAVGRALLGEDEPILEPFRPDRLFAAAA